jgi:putative pyoverdin transport system ATP-binding/permease protein
MISRFVLFLFVPLLALLTGAYIYVRRSLPPADGRAIKLQESVRGLIHGTKELKLSKVKKDRYFDEVLLASEYDVLNNSKIANTIVSAAANYGEVR